MKLHCTDFCWDCIDRQIVQALRIKEVLSDLHNCEQERQRIIELLRERERLTEEIEKMGRKI
jgi:hypothetical protein